MPQFESILMRAASVVIATCYAVGVLVAFNITTAAYRETDDSNSLDVWGVFVAMIMSMLWPLCLLWLYITTRDTGE